MKTLVLGLALVALGACVAPAPAPVVPAPVFRDQSAQIASQTDVTAARMAGTWHIRQGFADGPSIGRTLEISTLPNDALQLRIMAQRCGADGCAQPEEVLVKLNATGPGRWTPEAPPAGLPDQEFWVMWMDFDSRTAAIGTPTGTFGWIIDRSATGGGDRVTAARDIMDWFGYDLNKLTGVEQ